MEVDAGSKDGVIVWCLCLASEVKALSFLLLLK
jgi:hypothetical protein